MLPWSGRLPLSPASAIYASTFFLLVLVHTLSGGLVGHLPALYGLPQCRPRCCQDGTGRVGYAVTGEGSLEPADCLTVDKCLVMWLISSQLSALPSNLTLLSVVTRKLLHPSFLTLAPTPL